MSPAIKASARSVRVLLASITDDMAAIEAGQGVNLDDAVTFAAKACNKLHLLRIEMERQLEDDCK